MIVKIDSSTGRSASETISWYVNPDHIIRFSSNSDGSVLLVMSEREIITIYGKTAAKIQMEINEALRSMR